ncbi:MAG: uracil-DNA glycosylase [Marmoricola sp.]|nr:uracil-DNA glycosylase [Marmoricola sp.]
MTHEQSPSRPARPGASWWVPERLEPALVALGVAECQGCELHECAPGIPGVAGTGPVPAPVVLVGSQPLPGDEDDQDGDGGADPVGEGARRVLRSALERAGLDPDATWSTYVVKHAGPDRRAGTGLDPAHVAACAPWWHAELEMVRPRWVVLLGDVVAQALLGSDHADRLVRGQPAAWPRDLDRPVRRLDVVHHPERVLLVGDPRDAVDPQGRPVPVEVDSLVADLGPAALAGVASLPPRGGGS